jgi:hypothetical protein
MYISMVPSLTLAQYKAGSPSDPETKALTERQGTVVLSNDREVDGVPLKAGMRVEFRNQDLVLMNINTDLKINNYVFKKGSSLYFHRDTQQLSARYLGDSQIEQKIVLGSVEVKLANDLQVGPYLFLAGSIINFNSKWELMLTYESHYRAVYHGLKITRINPFSFHKNGAPQGVTADEGNLFHGIKIMYGSPLSLYDDGTLLSITSPQRQIEKIGLYTYDLGRGVTFHKNSRVNIGSLAHGQRVGNKWQEGGTTIELDEKGKLTDAWMQR